MFTGIRVKLFIAGMTDHASYPIRFLAFMLMSSGYVYLRYFL